MGQPPTKGCADNPKWAKKGKCSKKCSGKCSKKCLKKCPRTCGVCKGETLLQSEASGSWDCFCSVKDTTYDTEKCEKLEHMAVDRPIRVTFAFFRITAAVTRMARFEMTLS